MSEPSDHIPDTPAPTTPPRGPGDGPITYGHLTPSSIRQALLDECGFDRVEQVRLMKKALASIDDSLDAMKQTPVTFNGEITTVHIQPDHTARAKAREQVIDLIGVNAPVHAQAEKPQAPSIPLPPWVKRVTIENQEIPASPPTPAPTDSQPARQTPTPQPAIVDALDSSDPL